MFFILALMFKRITQVEVMIIDIVRQIMKLKFFLKYSLLIFIKNHILEKLSLHKFIKINLKIFEVL